MEQGMQLEPIEILFSPIVTKLERTQMKMSTCQQEQSSWGNVTYRPFQYLMLIPERNLT